MLFEVVGELNGFVYDIVWIEFLVVVLFVEVLNVVVVDCGLIGDVLVIFVFVLGVCIKVIGVNCFDLYGMVVFV